MPETFVIDRAGRIAYKHVGPISRDALTRTLLPTIARLKAEKPTS
jgi:cytochrome c biogenesis protein CcmG/thiol:disulfide interchange protein DsbE